MWKPLKTEIKNSIFKTLFHFIRFGGLLLIPLIYGFSYVYAFFDPFSKVDQLNLSFIVHVDSKDKNKPSDFLAKSLGKEVSKKHNIKMGNMNMTMHMKYIYTNDNVEKVINKHNKESYMTMAIPNVKPISDAIVNSLDKDKKINGFKLIYAFSKLKNDFINNKIKKPILILNDKKNYLLAFGVDIGLGMTSTYATTFQIMIDSLKNKKFLNSIGIKNINKAINTINKFEKRITNFKIDKDGNYVLDKDNQKIYRSIIDNISQMKEYEKYGYGLAPFFMAVAMWVGGMVMTFAVHRKIYDLRVTPGKRYFAKWLLISFGLVIQATILMFCLYFIGFKTLGTTNVIKMYLTIILSGLIFSSIIQALRFSIHNRNLGIIIIIFLLVLQMGASGGLYPIQLQNPFWGFINKISPMTRVINMIRETSFETNWENFFVQLGYLLLWLILIPIGIIINYKRTIQIYKKQGFTLPKKINDKIIKRNKGIK